MFSSFFFIVDFSLFFKNIDFSKYIKLFFVYLFVIFLANVCLYSFNMYLNQPIENEIMMGEYLPKDFNFLNSFSSNNIKYDRKNDALNVSVIKNVDDVEVPLIYYKGYVACNDKCYDVFKTNNGLVGIRTDKNLTDFKVWYKGTKIYNVSKYFSFLGILILAYKIKKYR